MKIQAIIPGLILLLNSFPAQAMPQDSTAYFRYLWNMGQSSKTFNLSGLGIASTGSILDLGAVVYSNGPNVNVDPLNRPSGSLTSGYRDRGGDIWITNAFAANLHRGAVWGTASSGSHANNVPGTGLFLKTEYSGTSNPRGWVRVRFLPSGGVSAATVSQPFAVQKSVIPIGTFPEKTYYFLATNQGIIKSRRVPLSDLGINANRILHLGAMCITDPNESGNSDFLEYNQLPQGVGGEAGPVSVRHGASGADIVLDVTRGPNHSNEVADMNRGYITVEHSAADCADGVGPLSNSANVGGRQLTAYTWNGSEYATNSAYQGCHGHLGGTYVIESTGDDIWTSGNPAVFDKFRYAYKSGMNGSKDLIARVDQLENTNAWARAGIMIRESTAGGSRNVGVFVTAGNGVIFQWRGSLNGATNTRTLAGGLKAPIWLRLRYENNETRAYYGSNGTTWTELGASVAGSYSNFMGGLAAASRSSYPGTSVYSGVSGF